MVDTEQFGALFDELYRPLRAHVLRRTGDRDDVDDIVSEIWTTAWRRRDDLPEDPDRARMYVYGVARNVMKNARRSVRRRRALEAKVSAMTASRPPARSNAHDLILEALDRLPERDQEILRLATWDQLSHPEIAELLGLSVTAVANRVARARRRLRTALTDLEEVELLPRVRES
ncbi:MAG: sigma-70 family RNA polymerase sigma factor [Nitriliruptorales bacterium]|nr:sigma-70 family RNA polymerase sigma factor [Nitriliruptorales bacterium]